MGDMNACNGFGEQTQLERSWAGCAFRRSLVFIAQLALEKLACGFSRQFRTEVDLLGRFDF